MKPDLSLSSFASTIPWDSPEVCEFRDVLANNFKNAGEIRTRLEQTGVQTSHLADGTPYDMWTTGMTILYRARKLRAFCDQMTGDSNLAALHPFAEKLLSCKAITSREAALDPAQNTATPQNAIHILYSHNLAKNSYFLNQKNLRSKLELLSDAQYDRRILRVMGPPGSGRSWVYRIVRAYAAALGDGFVLLDRDIAATPQDAVNCLQAKIGFKKVENLSTESDWFKKIFDAMWRAAEDAQKKWWIVVDDCSDSENGEPPISTSVMLLVCTIGMYLRDPDYGKHFCLILLGFNIPPPPPLRSEHTDEVELASVSQQDVQEAFTSILLKHGVRYHESEILQMADVVWKDYNAPQGRRPLERLQIALCREVALRLRSDQP